LAFRPVACTLPISLSGLALGQGAGDAADGCGADVAQALGEGELAGEAAATTSIRTVTANMATSGRLRVRRDDASMPHLDGIRETCLQRLQKDGARRDNHCRRHEASRDDCHGVPSLSAPPSGNRSKLIAAGLWLALALLFVAWALLVWHPWIDWFGRPR
jgi:hypothetical protein